MKELTRIDQGWKRYELESVDEILDVLNDKKWQRKKDKKGNFLLEKYWICHGQGEFGKLIPSFEYKPWKDSSRANKLRVERNSIEKFRNKIETQYKKNGKFAKVLINCQTSITTLLYMRHFKVDTRFLDWSVDPFVSAYFAATCENENDNGEIWCFDGIEYQNRGAKQWKKYPRTTYLYSGISEEWNIEMPTAFELDNLYEDWFVCYFYTAYYNSFPRLKAQHALWSFTPKFNVDHANSIIKLVGEDHCCCYTFQPGLKQDLLDRIKSIKNCYTRKGYYEETLYPKEINSDEIKKIAEDIKRKVFTDDLYS